MHRETELRVLLGTLLEVLVAGEDAFSADQVRRALSGTPQLLVEFLTSNELWGGSGSIADQGGIHLSRQARRPIEAALVALGEAQLRDGVASPRTGMWVETFKMWHDRGI